MPNNKTKKNIRKKWIEMANKNILEKQQMEMFKSIEKQQMEIKKMLIVEEYIENEKYLSALKYIHKHYPEFVFKKPKIYKWLKIQANTNNINNKNIENLREINISKFKIKEGNNNENVNVYELFGNNKGGGHRRKTLKRKTNEKY